MLEKVLALPVVQEFLADTVFIKETGIFWASSGDVTAWRRFEHTLPKSVGTAKGTKFLKVLETYTEPVLEVKDSELVIKEKASYSKFPITNYQKAFEPPEVPAETRLPFGPVVQYIAVNKLPGVAPKIWGLEIPGIWIHSEGVFAIDFGLFLIHEASFPIEEPVFIPTRFANLLDPGLLTIDLYQERVVMSCPAFGISLAKAIGSFDQAKQLIPAPEPLADVTLLLTKQALKRIAVLAGELVTLKIKRRNELWVTSPDFEEQVGILSKPIPELTVDFKNLRLWWQTTTKHQIAKDGDTFYLTGEAFDSSTFILQTTLEGTGAG